MELEQKQREEEDALYRKFLQVRLVASGETIERGGPCSLLKLKQIGTMGVGVGNPEPDLDLVPQDPDVYGHPGSGSGSFGFLIKVLSGLK
jgi:hypothetical protein